VITQEVTSITPLPSFLAPERPEAVDNLVEAELPLLTEELAEVISQINSTETNINNKEASVTNKYNEIQPHFDEIDLVAAAIASGDLPTIIDDADTSALKTWSSEKIDSEIDIHNKTAKTTLVDADEFMTADSTSTWSLKKITWANIKATLALLFMLKVNTPTTNALGKIDASGNIVNSNIINDVNGNVGIGGTLSVWFNSSNLQIGAYLSAFTNTSLGSAELGSNLYRSGASTYNYINTNYATLYRQRDGQHQWLTTSSGTAGNPITWTNPMTLDVSGNLLVGVANGSSHTLAKGTVENDWILNVSGINQGCAQFFSAGGGGYNASQAAQKIQRNTITLRSINAAGTINASGADYAEYEYSNDITITRGQIVGFKADGTLTDKYSESIRFAIKSTNPSIVGGDVWGNEYIVGKRPEKPVRKLDKTEQVQIEESEEFETVIVEAGDTNAEWELIEAKYNIDLADFEARLEVERQKVDRIAYAGKVPVNVYEAVAGQYIIAVSGSDDSISGLAVNKVDMTFTQYQDAVGRVNKILDDGRAEVAVIIH